MDKYVVTLSALQITGFLKVDPQDSCQSLGRGCSDD